MISSFEPSAPARRRHAGASLKTGAYEFIPLPFVDDWLIFRQRKEMVRTILGQRGLTCDAGVPGVLAGSAKSLGTRLRSLAKGLFLKPMRKVFRSVFFWITARRAARTVLETYFLGRFLHHPGLIGGGAHLTRDDARQLAGVFREVARNIDLKAAGDLAGKVRRLLIGHRPAEVTSEEMRGAIEREAPGFIDDFDRLVGEKLAARSAG